MSNIGFKDLNDTLRTPDKGLSFNTVPRVRIAKFGDGYSQRVPYGMNNLNQTFSVNFNGRTKEEIDAIVSFFDSKEGAQSFEFTIPFSGDGVPSIEDESEKTILVYCQTWSQTFTHDNFYNLSATFERVYESPGQ